MAVLALPLLKGFLPNVVSLVGQMSKDGIMSNFSKILDSEKMRATLDEIYNKCNEQSSIKAENTLVNRGAEIVN